MIGINDIVGKILERRATVADTCSLLVGSFATALARAISRAQEGLSPANTIAAYERIYFPAQRIHLAQDKPRENGT